MQHIHIHTETEGPTGSPETTEFINQAIESVISLIKEEDLKLPPKLSKDELKGQLRRRAKIECKKNELFDTLCIVEQAQAIRDYVMMEAMMELYKEAIYAAADEMDTRFSSQGDLFRIVTLEELRWKCAELGCRKLATRQDLRAKPKEGIKRMLARSFECVYLDARKTQRRKDEHLDTAKVENEETLLLGMIKDGKLRDNMRNILRLGPLRKSRELDAELESLSECLKQTDVDEKEIIKNAKRLLQKKRLQQRLGTSLPPGVVDLYDTIGADDDREKLAHDMANAPKEVLDVFIALCKARGERCHAKRRLGLISDSTFYNRLAALQDYLIDKGWWKKKKK